MRKRIFALLLAVVMLTLSACSANGAGNGSTASGTTSSTASAPSSWNVPERNSALKPIAKEDLKVGFIYIGPINDEGYTQAHDQGRLALNDMGIETAYVENVLENADCEKSIRDLIDQGCNVVYVTSAGHLQYAQKVAKDYPEVYFGHGTGGTMSDNMTTYMGRIIEARYLAGIVAGKQTGNNKIGYVAAYPFSEVIRGINAFTLGVKSVNPTATVEVVFTSTWYDPAVEKQAALELLNKGCDVIAQHQDSTAAQIAAQEKGAFAIGYNTSTPDAAPDAYLTAPLFHWAKFYTDDIQKIIDGTWAPRFYWEGLASGMVSLDELSPLVKDGVADAVEEAKNAIISGDIKLFTGEIKDQSGKVRVAAGETMSDQDIWSMNWFVDGVVGTIPAN